MMYAADDSFLSVDEFQRLLSDRSVSWKLRATIDYSLTDLDRSFLKKVEEQANDVAKGARKAGPALKDPDAIVEDDFFKHSTGSFLQTKSRFTAPV
jgi:hypothetical protein